MLAAVLLACAAAFEEYTGPPRVVLYVDDTSGLTEVNFGEELRRMADANVTHILLAFWAMTPAQCAKVPGALPKACSGPVDAVLLWTQVAPDERQRTVEYLHARGAQLLVSSGGATDNPVTGDHLSTAAEIYGMLLGQFAADYLLDGVDFDFEDGGAFTKTKNSTWTKDNGVRWLCDATKAAKSAYTASPKTNTTGVVTHAPQAPYFAKPWDCYGANGQHGVEEMCGDLVDFYNVQFYNQGSVTYMTCYALVEVSDGGDFTAAREIADQAGVPWSKLVLGKGQVPADLTNTGYMAPDYFAWAVYTLVQTHRRPAGVMAWQWHPQGFVDAKGKPQSYGGISTSPEWAQLLYAAQQGTPPTDFPFFHGTTEAPDRVCEQGEQIPDSPGLHWRMRAWEDAPDKRCLPTSDPLGDAVFASRGPCSCAIGGGCSAEEAVETGWPEQAPCQLPGQVCGGSSAPSGVATGTCCSHSIKGNGTFSCSGSNSWQTCKAGAPPGPGPGPTPGGSKYACDYSRWDDPKCKEVSWGDQNKTTCEQNCKLAGLFV